jgi:hypothetical protein
MTKGVLEGYVSTSKSGQSLTHTLAIIAPALNQYIFLVLTVNHRLEVYPATVRNEMAGEDREVQNEEQLTAAVREILSSERVKSVVAGLLSQSVSA